jgi:hypothetical protein
MKFAVFATLLASASAFGINKADLGKVSIFFGLMSFRQRALSVLRSSTRREGSWKARAVFCRARERRLSADLQ